VGIDVTLPWDRLFVHADATGGCSVQNLLQMTLRLRSLRNHDVPVLLQPKHFHEKNNCVHAFPRALEKLRLRQGTVEDIHERYALRWTKEFGEGGVLQHTPDPFTEVVAYTRAANQRTFLAHFHRLALYNGHRVVFDSRPQTALSADHRRAVKAVAAQALADESAARKAVLERGPATVLLDKTHIRREGTKLERREVELAFHARHWDPPLNESELKFAERHFQQIVALAQLSRMSEMRMLTADRRRMAQPCADLFQSFITEVHESIQEAVILAGFTGLFDEKRIDQHDADTRGKEITALCAKSRAARGKPPYLFKCWSTALRTELSEVYSIDLQGGRRKLRGRRVPTLELRLAPLLMALMRRSDLFLHPFALSP
jgi:hypothetical protein